MYYMAWSSDFSGLCNRAPRDAPTDSAVDFYDKCMSHKKIVESEMENNFGGIALLNEKSRYDDVEKLFLTWNVIKHWELMAYQLMSCEKNHS